MAGGKAFLIKVPLAKEFINIYYAQLISPLILVYFVVTDSVIYLHPGASTYISNYNVTTCERHSCNYKQYTRVKVSTW